MPIRSIAVGLAVAASLVLAGCQQSELESPTPRGSAAAQSTGDEPIAVPRTPTDSTPPEPICDSALLEGPPRTPEGSVVVEPGEDLAELTARSPAGTRFYLLPGTHTLAGGEFGQVVPKNGNTYVGAPGAVLDGRGVNRYAFTQEARDVTIEHLTVRGFQAPNNEGVVNHNAGDSWTIRYNTIEKNAGSGLMIGDRNLVEANCLRNNGQYGFSAYSPDGVVDVVVRGNEVTGNNTDDWEAQRPGCGCTGGGKFWNTFGAEVTDNYVHGNLSVGIWADGNNSDFLIQGNYIADNLAEGIFYEQSYNARIIDNVLVGNAVLKGPTNPGFPAAAIYISEAGGDPRAPGGLDTLEIAGNLIENNWSGVILWENADRFAGSPANTSTGLSTLVNPDANLTTCSNPTLISTAPFVDDCRWKTQNVDVHDNTFVHEPEAIGEQCDVEKGCGFNGLFSNFGTYPDWSPFQGTRVQDALTFDQGNTFRANTYQGPWAFKAYDQASIITWAEWRADPVLQDAGSTIDNNGEAQSPSNGR